MNISSSDRLFFKKTAAGAAIVLFLSVLIGAFPQISLADARDAEPHESQTAVKKADDGVKIKDENKKSQEEIFDEERPLALSKDKSGKKDKDNDEYEDEAASLEPANREANKDVKAILNYLSELRKRDEGHVISGQFAGHAATPGSHYLEDYYVKLVEDVEESTGESIGMVGVDYAQLTPENPKIDLTLTNQPIMDQWTKGGLTTISWHARNPWTAGNSRDKEIDGKFSDILTEGTEANRAWMKDLDQIAAGLSELQDAGVSVLWRPLHESTSAAFWWSKATPKEFKALWQHMFEYFTEEKGLNNLLWVYSVAPKTKSNPERRSEETNYPGAAFVDVTGLDYYGPDLAEIKASAQKLVKLGKPFGLTEYGPHKGSKTNPPPTEPYFSYVKLAEQMKKNLPDAVFFQTWNHAHSMAQQLDADELLRDPWVTDAREWK